MKYYVVLNRTENDGIYEDDVIGVKTTKNEALKLMQEEMKRVEQHYYDGQEAHWHLTENKNYTALVLDLHYMWVNIELQEIEEV